MIFFHPKFVTRRLLVWIIKILVSILWGTLTWNNLFMSFELTFHQKLKQQNTKLERTKNRIEDNTHFFIILLIEKKSYLHVEMKRKNMSMNDLNQETFSCRMEHISFRNCWSMILPSGSESKEALLYSYFGDMNWGGSRKKKSWPERMPSSR